jgi:hypothetical protein
MVFMEERIDIKRLKEEFPIEIKGTVPELIVVGIIDDLKGRSGLEDMWYEIDENTRKEIFRKWVSIARMVLVGDE